MSPLHLVSLFSKDIQALGNFYAKTFALSEQPGSTPVYRAFDVSSGIALAISDWSIYDVLELEPRQPGSGDQAVMTFAAQSESHLHFLFGRAINEGAISIRAPFTTSYGWLMCVMRDLDGNAFRISWAGQ